MIWAELRRDPDVVMDPRRVPDATQRQATTIALLGVGLVALGTRSILAFTGGQVIRRAVFIVTSAFATSGLSIGLVPNLSAPAQVIVIILMFVGQVGTIVAGSSRALSAGQRLYRYPAEQTLVG